MADATFESLIIGDVHRAHLSLSSRGLKLHDDTRAIRAELWQEDDNPTLLMYDRHGQERLALEVEADGTPHIRLYDANGKQRLSVSIEIEGTRSWSSPIPSGSTGSVVP